MGKTLGSFTEADELDRPDLNKCPDCGCFFADENCPLCGKPCPEEFRAGNRKRVKPPKRRRGGDSGRVTFVEWYHSWWFIILMLFMFPLIGVILLATSPHKKVIKYIVIGIVVIYALSTLGIIGNLVNRWSVMREQPVNQKLSRDEYIAACETVEPEAFYRSPESYEKNFVTMKLTVIARIADSDAYYSGSKYHTYYICRDASGTFTFLVRDCNREGTQNYIPGDTITVWGEGAGNVTVYDMDYNAHAAPGINAAFITRQGVAV